MYFKLDTNSRLVKDIDKILGGCWVTRIFDKKNIIIVKIDEDDLNSFLVDVDIDDEGKKRYMLDEFSSAIINTIPEYVFADYENSSINQIDLVEKLRESARCIYKIDDYELMRRYYLENDNQAREVVEKQGKSRRGEFGELLLHLLLRDFKNTIPLISKVYFKDARGVAAHGFDAVHISSDQEILWLGESKFYTDSKKGIGELVRDLKDHINSNYLEEQCLVIKKNLENNSIPQRDEWVEKLNTCNKLKDRIKLINIPLLCIYPNEIYDKFFDINEDDAVTYHEQNIMELKEYFEEKNDHPLREQLNIILMLFPIRNKKELMVKLHERLWHMQNM